MSLMRDDEAPSHLYANSAPVALRIFEHRSKTSFATWGNSGIQPARQRHRESALQEHMRPASCGLSTMESDNGILCWTGRVVEADIDLRGEPGGIDRARRRGRL